MANVAIRILIVDDHPLVREGLIGLLVAERDFEICGEAGGVVEARELAAREAPDVAIIDLALKDGSGIELIKELHAQATRTKLVALTMHDESLFAERALRAGAVGYVNKHEASRTIIKAIRTVLEGKFYLSQRMMDRIVERAVGKGDAVTRSPIERLTDREMEVFEMIGQGLSSKQIATRLGLSPKTVDTYRERLKEKFDLKSTNELTKHAVQWVLENH